MKRGIIFGVFDLLHIGHVKILEEAKKFCDHLTVCVFDDLTAQSYKRKPIIEESMRTRMVKSLESVDDAYLIHHRTAIEKQEVDVFFVSEKLMTKKLYMVPEGRVNDIIYLPYSSEINTTAIIRECQIRIQ